MGILIVLMIFLVNFEQLIEKINILYLRLHLFIKA